MLGGLKPRATAWDSCRGGLKHPRGSAKEGPSGFAPIVPVKMMSPGERAGGFSFEVEIQSDFESRTSA